MGETISEIVASDLPGLMAMAPVGFGEDMGEVCSVTDAPSLGLDMAFLVDMSFAGMQSFTALLAVGPDLSEVELPVGPAYRIDVTIDDGGTISENTIYLFFGDQEILYELTCSASVRPGDAWLRIAESFDYLGE